MTDRTMAVSTPRLALTARVRNLALADTPLAVAFVGSRLLLLAAAVVAERLAVRNPNLTSGDTSPLLTSLTSWDGWWYLGIARDGYHAAPLAGGYHDYAFLPLYPLLVRVFSLGNADLVGPVAVLVSNALFLVALALLVRLGTPYLGRERAVAAGVLLSVLPFGAVFGMAYGESLFLVLSIAACLAVERGHLPLAGVLVALATLTRLQGVLLVVPLAILAVQRARGIRPTQAWLVLGPLTAVGFIGYVATLSGDASGFSSAQSAWGRGGVAAAETTDRLGAQLSGQNVVSLVTLCVVLFVLLATWRRSPVPVAYRLIPLLSLGAVFASGILESVGRYAVVAFPLAWLLAERLPTGRRFTVAAGLFAALFLVVTTVSFAGWLVP